jgi:hypothetical protein
VELMMRRMVCSSRFLSLSPGYRTSLTGIGPDDKIQFDG